MKAVNNQRKTPADYAAQFIQVATPEQLDRFAHVVTSKPMNRYNYQSARLVDMCNAELCQRTQWSA